MSVVEEKIGELAVKVDGLSQELKTAVTELKSDVSDLKRRADKSDVVIEEIRRTMVTKADLESAMNAQLKWIVGVLFGLTAAAVTVMTFVLNNAVPKPVPAAPVVIQWPGAPAPLVQPALPSLAPRR